MSFACRRAFGSGACVPGTKHPHLQLWGWERRFPRLRPGQEVSELSLVLMSLI